MKKQTPWLFAAAFSAISFVSFGQTNSDLTSDVVQSTVSTYQTPNPGNIGINRKKAHLPNLTLQQEMRERPNWQNFLTQNGDWWVEFNEEIGLPSRAMGKPIQISGGTFENMAMNFIQSKLVEFNLPVGELQYTGTSSSPNHNWVRFKQTHNGLDVFGSEVVVKITNNGQVIMFGTKVYNHIPQLQENIGSGQAEAFAQAGLIENITSTEFVPGKLIVPIEEVDGLKFYKAFQVKVHGFDADGIPVRYYTLVDAGSGNVLYRADEVMHAKGEPEKPKSKKMAGVIEIDLEGSVYTTHTYNPATIEKIPNLDFTINGSGFQTDINGYSTTTESGPATATFDIAGAWSTVVNGATTPSFTATVNDGVNVVDASGQVLIQELSAYYHVNIVHDYCKTILPTFTGMDFSLTTNVDLNSGTCNAFYNGSSINFYADGGGCLTYANVADVVYHEYGHGINDNFYQDQSSFFQNGAMGEGYADIWAMAITLNPILGVGGDDSDPTAFIRRYDTLPKVYPDDIHGEVHDDGEIIAGAWWDTYLNFGSNMPQMMALFADAYYGLQATSPNGQEGTAFTNVLIDALQADDVPGNGGDNDITNGTPNGLAIVDAFDLHGITLISNAVLNHTDILDAPENAGITIDADLTLNFPFTTYLNSVSVSYSLNNTGTWSSVAMTNTSGNNYQGVIPAQPVGTVVKYYVWADDINNQVAAVQPVAADLAVYPGLPYYILVGYALVGEDDVADFVQDFGVWVKGAAGDNATTGQWTETIPLGSFGTPGDPSTIVQTDDDHTPGGDICFVTGNASSINDGIGAEDVDAGHTTLTSPVFDLSINQNPTFTYWRWYTNAPASGANPKADWWQVFISNDNGSTWVPIENTINGQIAWRRNAFRVADYVTPTNQVMMKFIASDSLRPGQNLDGGSLVEGALDDIKLWDDVDFWGVDDIENISSLNVYPNPADEDVNLDFMLEEASEVSVYVYNAGGQMVFKKQLGKLAIGEHKSIIERSALSSGTYNVRIVAGERGMTRKFTILK